MQKKERMLLKILWIKNRLKKSIKYKLITSIKIIKITKNHKNMSLYYQAYKYKYRSNVQMNFQVALAI
mgnify:CR=1 FL=1